MDISDLFWNASREELKRGYIENEDNYICLLCGKKVEKGIIYPCDNILYEANKYMRIHITGDHKSVFENLISLDKKITGLSDHQSELLRLFYQGKSDSEIQKEMSIGSSSTIRNHRFVLKEKERQAKVFLVLMELLKENAGKPQFVSPHKTAKMVDDRYKVTEDENEKIIKKYFPEGPNGKLKTFAIKEKNKLVVLRQIVKHFKPNCIYSEKEVNEILKNIYGDFVTLRRYLIEYGFMDRKSNGSEYWLKDEAAGKDELEGKALDRKKELIQQYKEMKQEAGIYQIRNKKNGKVLVIATKNLRSINGKAFQLNMGGFLNKGLQEEWSQYGEEAFEFEVLEVLKEKEEGYFDRDEELKKLEKKWLEELQPYGERGYNRKKD